MTTKFKNPIPKCDLFATPKSMEDLTYMISNMGTPEEQRLAWMGAAFALNLAHNLVEEQS